LSNLKDLADFPLLAIWGETVRARRVQGDRITLAVVELAPNAVVPEHVHENEQLDEAQFARWVKQASRLPGWDGTNG